MKYPQSTEGMLTDIFRTVCICFYVVADDYLGCLPSDVHLCHFSSHQTILRFHHAFAHASSQWLREATTSFTCRTPPQSSISSDPETTRMWPVKFSFQSKNSAQDHSLALVILPARDDRDACAHQGSWGLRLAVDGVTQIGFAAGDGSQLGIGAACVCPGH